MAELLAGVVGPFFLGFMLEAFGDSDPCSDANSTDTSRTTGMGVVLMLSVNYFTTQAAHHSVHGSHEKLGPSLVASSLVFSLVQTLVDLCRGWDMFARNFANLSSLGDPSPLFFISPLLGLIPPVLTQGFLLRRLVLFVSSLEVLWPRLAHPCTKYTFVVVMVAGIAISTVFGSISSYLVWQSGGLGHLHAGSQDLFGLSSVIWFATSSAVDIVLSVALCTELWWARRKLAATHGRMREVVTRLILITFHGGIAVTALQLVALGLYQTQAGNAFCYLPVIPLPKIYTVTLILSLCLPPEHLQAAAPSHVFSLPTISNSLAAAPSPAIVDNEKSRSMLKWDRKPTSPRVLSTIAERGIRRSQEWLSWSLVGGLNGRNSSSPASEGRRSRNKYSRHEGEDGLPLAGAQEDCVSPSTSPEARRPSATNSTAPLLRDHRSHSFASSIRRSSYPPSHQTLFGHSPSLVHLAPTRSHGSNNPSLSTIPSPPPTSITVSRQHSFSAAGWDSSIGRAKVALHPSLPILASPTWQDEKPIFNTVDPFASTTQPRPPFHRLDLEITSGRAEPRRVERMMSFSDMLGGPDGSE
ncbi:hypothetical protein P7C73_g1808, partial [Tremellales sp. Uapishka_1]